MGKRSKRSTAQDTQDTQTVAQDTQDTQTVAQDTQDTQTVALPSAPNMLFFGSKYAHHAVGTLYGDECAHCGKRTQGGRGVQYVGLTLDTDSVLRPEHVAAYNAQGGSAVLALIGEDCYYRNRDALKRWTTTVRSKAGETLKAQGFSVSAWIDAQRVKLGKNA
jgi:hypothetical protein